jgi:membrane associated rhomboid family serine protease
MALFNSIWDDLKYSLRSGSMVTKLMIINFTVFVMVYVVFIGLWLALGGDRVEARELLDRGLNWLCMPGKGEILLWQIWSPITSIFLHEWLGHFLGNMIALYLFGTIVADLIGDRRVFPLYLLGGLVGNALYFISAQFLSSVGLYALGASGAIMALAGAALILAPDYRVMLFLLGEVKVKYIVLVLLLLDLVSIANAQNTGGHAAHLGGFVFGCLFVYRLRDGRDMSEPVNRLLDKITGMFASGRRRKKAPRRRPQMAVKGPFAASSKGNPSVTDQEDLSFQEKLDTILDKIKAHGYENLTPEEKEFLYNASKK